MKSGYPFLKECKADSCKFKSNEPGDFDDEGYCRACSEVKSDLQREAAN